MAKGPRTPVRRAGSYIVKSAETRPTLPAPSARNGGPPAPTDADKQLVTHLLEARQTRES